jgi:enamidase
MISAGEVHTPGRPKDVVGLKAMAIFAQRAFSAFRPGGVKIHAGAPVLEHGMVEEDFKELAAAGVTMLGEVGLGSVKDGATARQMVAWARKHGIQSTIHTGGPSIPGSSLIDKDIVLAADADVIGHINGGHTALPDDQIVSLCEKSPRALEIVHNGNERAALLTLRTARELKQLSRIILGTDSPAGSGVQPLGIIRLISMLSSLGGVPAEVAICCATGNTAKIRNLSCGSVATGRDATFVLMDKAQHSAGSTVLKSIEAGDLPGIGMVIIEGVVSTQRSRNTPPASRVPEMVNR